MKHCPKCLEEYQNVARKCAECGAELLPGPPPKSREKQEAYENDDETSTRDLDNAETVFAGSREIGEPLALALCRTGIPAVSLDCDPLAAGEDEGTDAVRIVVPIPFFEAASWFVHGFEAALMPPLEQEQPEE